jgi:plastocyanin
MPRRRMRARAHALAAALAVSALATGLLSCVSERATGTRTDVAGCDVRLPSEAVGSTIVIIRDFAFSPAQVRVPVGGKVTWVNCGAPGSDAHTSTADAGAWSSPLLAPGETYTREFAAAGALPYHCEPHPGMTGTVTVE